MRDPKIGWVVVTCPAPRRGEEPFLVEAMRRCGARTVDREGERFAGYFPAPDSEASLLEELRGAIRGATSMPDPDLASRFASREDWARLWGPGGMDAARVSARLVVVPDGSHAAEEATDLPGCIPLRLHPGPFFGSAEHPTTRACLRLLDEFVRPGDRLLDVGSGSGILAIAGALLGAGDIVALESDPAACGAARDNAALNEVADIVEVMQVEADAANLGSLGRFDGVLANIEPGGLIPLLPGLVTAARPGGWIVISGVPGPERSTFLESAARAELHPARVEATDGWITAVFAIPRR